MVSKLAFSSLLTSFALATLTATSTQGKDRVNDPSSFTWHPERSPNGPVVVTVNLSSQTVAVYRNGILIGTCLVSTGKPGHETPTGTFHILEKDADHHSATYNNASMPFSERLTWGGVALHAGGLPGYPSSHGCIHLPYEFSEKLFEITSVGGTVVISDGAGSTPEPGATAKPGAPMPIAKPAPKLSQGHRIEFRGENESEVTFTPHVSPSGPVSVIFSSSDKAIQIIRNGKVIAGGAARLNALATRPKGTYTFVCDGWTKDGDGQAHPHWHQVAGPEGSAEIKAFYHLKIDPRLQHALATMTAQGTTLILTNQPLAVASRGEPGFSIMQGSLPKK